MKRFLFILLLPVLFFGQVNAQKIQPSFRPVITAPISDDIYGGFCQEYQTVYDAYTTKPDAATAAIWNTFVESIVASGEWDMLDVLYVYAAHTNAAGEALINWKLPGTFNATAFNAPAFVANQGFTGANTKYIDWNWNPSANGVNYVQDDASAGCYIRTNVAEDTYSFGCNSAGNYLLFRARDAGDIAKILINGGTFGTVANLDSRGMYIGNRVLSTHQDLYKNKVRIINGAQASTGIPNLNVFTLGQNNNGVAANFSTKQYSMAFAGAGMTQTHVNNFTDPFETAMDALGTGVIAYNPLEDLMMLQYLAFKQRINENNLVNITH